MNTRTENIGARRLHHFDRGKILADISFDASERGGTLVIDREHVVAQLADARRRGTEPVPFYKTRSLVHGRKCQSQVLIESLLPYLVRSSTAKPSSSCRRARHRRMTALKAAFALEHRAAQARWGIHPVVVHGGGPRSGNDADWRS